MSKVDMEHLKSSVSVFAMAAVAANVFVVLMHFGPTMVMRRGVTRPNPADQETEQQREQESAAAGERFITA